MKICELIVSTTRKCNMTPICHMCIRGDPQNVDIDDRIFPQVFEEVKWIRRLYFAGGEPTMNVRVLRQVVGLMESSQHLGKVGSVCIISNGKEFVEEVCTLFGRMVELCVTNEHTEFTIGTSEFHERGPGIHQYQKWAGDRGIDWLKWRTVGVGGWVINTGKAKENGLGQREISFRASEPFMYWNGELRRVFISAVGDVGTWCDLSYEDMPRFSRGNILRESLTTIVERNADAGSV